MFLTGNPQITFFKVVYRRHTNFSKECIKQEFNGSLPSTKNSQRDVTCTLARNGDLVQEIYLQATLNATDTTVTITNGVFTAANIITVAILEFKVGDVYILHILLKQQVGLISSKGSPINIK